MSADRLRVIDLSLPDAVELGLHFRRLFAIHLDGEPDRLDDWLVRNSAFGIAQVIALRAISELALDPVAEEITTTAEALEVLGLDPDFDPDRSPESIEWLLLRSPPGTPLAI
jgi:hypothetical protein